MDAAALFLGFLAGIAAVLVFAMALAVRRGEAGDERHKSVQPRTCGSGGAVPPPPKRVFDAPATAAKPSARIIPLRKTPDDGDAA